MEVAEENLGADSGGDVEEEEVEEVEEEVEEVEEEVEEEEEEEVDEVEEEEEEKGNGGERDHSTVKALDTVDSAGQEIQQPVSASSSSGKIFVGGVAWETTEEAFTRHFAKYGHITDSVIMKDKLTHTPRGFGFVTFADPSVIDKLLEDEHVIDGRTVEVKRTVPREDMPPKEGPKTKKIFVGGIPASLTEDEFKEYFSSYGQVVEHQIMVDHHTGRSRGFGFITFESEESVEKVISEGRMHDLAGKQVEIKKAEPKKAGGDGGISGRGGYGGGFGNSYAYGSGFYDYNGGYRSVGGYYGGRDGGFYGRGGYGYGGAAGYAAGFGSGYVGSMYGPAGYGGNDYGASGGAYGSHAGGRGYGSRYHPYGR